MTPSSLSKGGSMHQKQPPANVALASSCAAAAPTPARHRRLATMASTAQVHARVCLPLLMCASPLLVMSTHRQSIRRDPTEMLHRRQQALPLDADRPVRVRACEKRLPADDSRLDDTEGMPIGVACGERLRETQLPLGGGD